MTISFQVFIFLTIALSMDAFTAAFSYGTDNVRVPFISTLIIAVICGLMLTLSFLAGNVLLSLIPSGFAKILSFSILFLLSLYKLYDALPKKRPASFTTDSISDKVNKKDKQIISAQEAALLALALSIDSISAGISIGTPDLPLPLLFLIAVCIHLAAIWSGSHAGASLSKKTSQNFSWLGAVLLLLLAFLRLL